MAGDYTRFTHKPRHRYSGVLMQQGRVQLDSDLNEQVEIVKYRWETQAHDIFGPSAVPAATTPNGFAITDVTPTDFLIGVGRMYVEGLLAENFAEDPPVSYLNQPFYPDPPDWSAGPGQSTLVYLDVWDREVTWLQNRGLLEPALLGPDTAARVQTVWQVKTHEGTCDRDLELLFPSSAARLSSRAVQPPSSEDPCILPPTGGYRGVENRLYRVEIHDAGDPQGPDGIASVRFKWSRENASVASPVESINGDTITVARIGRDKVLRFSVGDWIELVDDNRELMEVAGQMARILEIDEANRVVTLDRVVEADFDATDATRHTRATRWDQKAPQNDVDGDGLVAGSDDWIALEDGVEVLLSLDPATGLGHVADYWVFAARTADASVEELDAAPPRGIVHHYCHLAEVSGAGGPVVPHPEDCRHLCDPCAGGTDHDGGGGGDHEPQAMCCVTVQPGQSIQNAINSLPPGGGCVCLQAGTHTITAPITILQSNVTLHAASLGAKIVGASNPVTLLQIEKADTVQVHDIWFDALQLQGEQAVIEIRGCHAVTIADCRIDGPVSATAQTIIRAIVASDCVALNVLRNELRSLPLGLRVDQCRQVRLAENRATAPGVINTGPSLQTVGIWVATPAVGVGAGPWHVESNVLEGYMTGVLMTGTAAGCAIIGNGVARAPDVVLQPQALLNPIALLTAPSPPQQVDDGRSYAIDVSAPQAVVRRNRINLSHAAHGGVRTMGRETVVEGNVISSDRPAVSWTPAPLGILVGPTDGVTPPDGSLIRSNLLTGGQDAIVVVGSALQRIRIDANHIEPSIQVPPSHPRLAVALKSTNGAVVERNVIRGATRAVSLSGGTATQVVHNDLRDGELGVLAYAGIEEAGLSLSHNYIENMEGPGIVGARLIGAASMSHDRIIRCGRTGLIAGSGVPIISPQRAGVFVETHGHLRLDSCEVLDAGVSPQGTLGSGPVIAMHIRVLSCQIASNRTAYSVPLLQPFQQGQHRALLLLELPQAIPQDIRAGHANVVGNSFFGPGIPHLVEIDRAQPTTHGFGDIVFTNNHCEHATQNVAPPPDAVTVSLRGGHLIVMGNHVNAVAKMASMNFHIPSKLALMGNITSGSHEELPPPNDLVPQNPAGFNIPGAP